MVMQAFFLGEESATEYFFKPSYR